MKLMVYSCILLFGVFISSISQVLLKKASSKEYSSKIREYLNVKVLVAYFIFFVSTLLSIYAYKVVPLSYGPVLEATSYIYITFFGIKIFKEKIQKRKICALLLIIFGICIYSFMG